MNKKSAGKPLILNKCINLVEIKNEEITGLIPYGEDIIFYTKNNVYLGIIKKEEDKTNYKTRLVTLPNGEKG